MLTVTGTAEFVHEDGETELRVVATIQPHVPQEHDTLVKIAGEQEHLLHMDHGQLILDARFTVPQRNLLADLEQTPSNPPSDATSVSEGEGDIW